MRDDLRDSLGGCFDWRGFGFGRVGRVGGEALELRQRRAGRLLGLGQQASEVEVTHQAPARGIHCSRQMDFKESAASWKSLGPEKPENCSWAARCGSSERKPRYPLAQA